MEPTSGLAAPAPRIQKTPDDPEKVAPAHLTYQEERNGSPRHSLRRASRGQKKDDEEEEKKGGSPDQKKDGGHGQVQQQFIVQPSRKTQPGSRQERARKGIGKEHRLDDKLRHIKERGVMTNKRHRPRDKLHPTNPFGNGQGHEKQDPLRQMTKRLSGAVQSRMN